MSAKIKQFIPEEYCLQCKGCCRFAQEDSVWLPCLLDEEKLELIDKEGIPPVSITADSRVHPVPNPKSEGFICPLLNIEDNKCKIYLSRPFECQLYPFLLNLRDKKVILTIDLNCPYAREKANSKEFKEYTEYLTTFLNEPAQIKILKANPQILQAYEEVSDIVELNF
ncbi:MAG: YkgJ family cysteine cluster protein [Candidatus Omnitrophica bacterium]|nr:YkgJ family cysteine cluster protein [Candidatus Omnitrophota bacterium]